MGRTRITPYHFIEAILCSFCSDTHFVTSTTKNSLLMLVSSLPKLGSLEISLFVFLIKKGQELFLPIHESDRKRFWQWHAFYRMARFSLSPHVEAGGVLNREVWEMHHLLEYLGSCLPLKMGLIHSLTAVMIELAGLVPKWQS